MPQQPQERFRKPLFVGASPTRGSSFKSGSWCNSSISPCERDGPGANPGFLTNLDGPKLIVYPPPNIGGRSVLGESSSAPGSIPGMECLRSITSLVHLLLPKRAIALPSAQNRVRNLHNNFAQVCRIFP